MANEKIETHFSNSPVVPDAHVLVPPSPGVLVTPYFDRFFRTHERVMWQFKDLDFTKIDQSKLTDDDMEAVMGAMLVESHNPVYTAGLLQYFRNDHEMTAFLPVWGYEELKHLLVLRTYLEASGRISPTELARTLIETRAGPWGEDEKYFTPLQSFTYTMMQEQVTGMFYKRFSENAQEPLLKQILLTVSGDEYRHCQFYLGKSQQGLGQDRKNRIDEVDDVLLRFRMPGPSFIRDYNRYGAAMARVSRPRGRDLQEVLGKVTDLVGKPHVLQLATRSDIRTKLKDEWGLDAGDAIKNLVLGVVNPLMVQ